MNEIGFIRVALDEARAAYDEGEYPVGAVVVRDRIAFPAFRARD